MKMFIAIELYSYKVLLLLVIKLYLYYNTGNPSVCLFVCLFVRELLRGLTSFLVEIFSSYLDLI